MTEARTTRKRHLRGIVVSDKAAKTITVELTRRFQHRKYGKFVQKKTRVHAHDESRAAHVGDTVEIIECRPMSRLKRWRLVQVIERGAEVVAVAPVPTTAGPAPAASPAPTA
jgi:small subunit ribosomal protein S17